MFNPDKINIHELAVEEPEKQAELSFDPERDITQEDWEAMKNSLNEKTTDDNVDLMNYAEQATCMKILDPKVSLDIKRTTLRRLEDLFYDGVGVKNGDQLPELSCAIKLLSPKIKLPLGDLEIRQIIKDDFVIFCEADVDPWQIVEKAKVLKIAGLGAIVRSGLDKENWEKIVTAQKESKRKDVGVRFAHFSAAMRVIDPVAELRLDKAAWAMMRKDLEGYREQMSWDAFALLAANMKILAAEKVEVTNKGLEITMPEKKGSLDAGVPPIPENKQF